MPIFKLNIRRFDLSVSPSTEEATIECNQNADYNEFKIRIMEFCNLDLSEHKIVKLRNSEQMMIPYSVMLNNTADTYFVDITNVSKALDTGKKLFQDAYINSVYSKLNAMESRIHQIEKLLPQIKCKQHAHIEDAVCQLSNRVLFLNRRFDETFSVQWQSKMPYSLA